MITECGEGGGERKASDEEEEIAGGDEGTRGRVFRLRRGRRVGPV